MSKIASITENIEILIDKLIEKIDLLEQKNIFLEGNLENAKKIMDTQLQEIEDLKSKNEALKKVNALLGSEENKRDTKLKINSLIREIDYCIAQISN